jgi:hypothetical protein
LSAGRLYHLLKTISEYFNWEEKKYKLNHYTYLFYKFLKKHYYIKSILLEDKKFLEIFEKIINSEVLWNKRHSWQISFVETREARKLLIWDFKDKECLIYKLIQIWEV